MTELSHVTAERERIEATLRRDGFRTLIDQVADYAIFLISVDKQTVSWNLGVERTLGYAAADFLGLTVHTLFTEDDCARGVPDAELAEARKAGRASDDRWMRKRDGSHFWANGVTTALYDDAGSLVGYTKVMRDMTAEREAEDRLREAQKLQAVGRLAGGVAHEVNNMMTVVGGFGELLMAHPPLDATARGFVEEIQRACGRATAVTRQLLAYSRRQMLRTERVGLADVVTGMEPLLRRMLAEDVDLRIETHRDCQVLADRGQLEQVLLNLAFNARDAMPTGGQLTIRCDIVTVDPASMAPAPLGDEDRMQPGPYAALSMIDTGHGIDAEVMGQMFEPFFTTKPVGRGTGLGLSTVYGIVRQSGGFLRVTSEVGRGTTFHLYFPQADTVAPRAQTAGDVPGMRQEVAPAWPSGTTVLLVEDEPMVRGLAVRQLQALGLEVLQAADGAEALAMVQGRERAVDVVLTDVVMPGMSGRQLAEHLLEVQPGVPVLFMSGYTEDEGIRRGVLEAGAPFLQKPFTLQQLRMGLAALVPPRVPG
jgi:two-component system cell cycle sensor histidine kinase/response regulator CckA